MPKLRYQYSKFILLLLMVIGCTPSYSQKFESDTYSKEELIKLNQTYIKVLREHRSKAAGMEVVVKFDTATMYTAHAFAYKLKAEGRIGHPPSNIINKYGVAEICQGLSADALKYYRDRNYEALARYVYMVFSFSPGHAKIQRSSKYLYIGVGCNNHAFVARLRDSPMPKELAESEKQKLSMHNF
ncbi:hypothetical protein [Rufibacter hautae]|uniref:CAP domain-containing protein n=1 Tax=Rufibacter hautae TaxID=2595005 RepID=A0A5B6TCQ0_9BACT|nr:hypothetical protein [Rufibacter hautae]KAA3436759.1 hypothetical protein FOA19_20490 [Rufibacter hautae]